MNGTTPIFILSAVRHKYFHIFCPFREVHKYTSSSFFWGGYQLSSCSFHIPGHPAKSVVKKHEPWSSRRASVVNESD